jgi:anaerobic carbon-monoxide dehydrogenase iron sulfur subunit
MAKVLMIHPDKCTGCRNCELACSVSHEGEFRPAASRIHVYNWERENVSIPMTCQQCSTAACVSVCPTGSMSNNRADGTVVWNASSCIGCRMCTIACPFGNATYDVRSNAVLKCDMCNGSPECVQFCPNGALEFVDDTTASQGRKKAYAARFKESL